MKLVNHTHWRSDQLRVFVVRVAAEELEPINRKRLVVTVRYNRGGTRHSGVSGRASIGGSSYVARHMRVMLPSGVVDRVDLVHTLAHEMGHLRGLRHRDMRGSPRYQRVGDWRDRYAWADALPLEHTVKQPRPSLEDRREARREHCARMVKDWTKRVRGAQTRLRAWTTRLKAVERRVAASAPGKEGSA